MLSYRIPREPSTPRISVWRKLKDLGVAQIGDGLVALPQSAKAQERLEWIASSVEEADGEATVWVASPTVRKHSERLISEMRDARQAEYARLLSEIESDPNTSARTVQKWRREWTRINKRDYFGAPLGDLVRIAIKDQAGTKSNEKTSL